MREQFKNYITNLDIFRSLNNDGIGLMNTNHKMNTLSFYRY